MGLGAFERKEKPPAVSAGGGLVLLGLRIR